MNHDCRVCEESHLNACSLATELHVMGWRSGERSRECRVEPAHVLRSYDGCRGRPVVRQTDWLIHEMGAYKGGGGNRSRYSAKEKIG